MYAIILMLGMIGQVAPAPRELDLNDEKIGLLIHLAIEFNYGADKIKSVRERLDKMDETDLKIFIEVQKNRIENKERKKQTEIARKEQAIKKYQEELKEAKEYKDRLNARMASKVYIRPVVSFRMPLYNNFGYGYNNFGYNNGYGYNYNNYGYYPIAPVYYPTVSSTPYYNNYYNNYHYVNHGGYGGGGGFYHGGGGHVHGGHGGGHIGGHH